MYRLVYVSRAKPGLSDADIGTLLDQSSSNNFERYITGFLVKARGEFMQALEGEEQEVRELYERICGDARHDCVLQIVGERIERRAFPDWSMNYHRVDGPAGSPAMLVRRDEPLDTLMPSDTPKDLLSLFARFISLR